MKRSKKGQSMVEYAVGLGCVTALCMVALGSLGHISGDIIQSVQSTINYGGSRPTDPGRMVNNSATPWVLNKGSLQAKRKGFEQLEALSA